MKNSHCNDNKMRAIYECVAEGSLFRALPGLRAESLAISSLHALKAGAWRSAHRDPFDRMLAAQSALESLPLATAYPAMRHFEIEVV